MNPQAAESCTSHFLKFHFNIFLPTKILYALGLLYNWTNTFFLNVKNIIY